LIDFNIIMRVVLDGDVGEWMEEGRVEGSAEFGGWDAGMDGSLDVGRGNHGRLIFHFGRRGRSSKVLVSIWTSGRKRQIYALDSSTFSQPHPSALAQN
jgi:hypothetical protein